MIGPGVGPSFYSGVPLPFPGATFGSDFTTNQYQLSGAVYGVPSSLPGFTFTRASTGYAQTVAGTLTSFASGAPRITDRGMLIEESRTNVVLWCRDLTNAAWTKSNATAVKDQTGPDGVANSASSLTATAGNATCLQAITLGSSARFQSAWVKRITGSGVINMTMDNGATWTAIPVTSSWTAVEIPTQTLANPTVGFRIVTNGDAIAVDFVQNETGAFRTSPIETTTASATRAADVAALGSLSLLTGYSLYGEWFGEALPTSARVLDISGSVLIRRAGSSVSFNGAGRERSRTGGSGLCKAASAIGASDIEAALNGVTAGAASGTFSAVTVTTLTFASTGSSSYLNGYLRKVIIYPTALSLADLVTLTT